jgi:hypothetical protein
MRWSFMWWSVKRGNGKFWREQSFFWFRMLPNPLSILIFCSQSLFFIFYFHFSLFNFSYFYILIFNLIFSFSIHS